MQNKKHSVLRSGGVIDVRNGGHKTGPRICSKHDKPVYVETGLDLLDGRQMYHALLEGHFKYEVVYRRPT